MSRLVRPPSVADYERMTQHARMSAARLVEEQIRVIEERRAAIRNQGVHSIGAQVRGAAQLIWERLPKDPPDVTLARLEELEDALNLYADPRSTRKQVAA